MSLTKKLLENEFYKNEFYEEEFYEYSESPCLHWMEQEFLHIVALKNCERNSKMPSIDPKGGDRQKNET
jgi:hypothetical protein